MHCTFRRPMMGTTLIYVRLLFTWQSKNHAGCLRQMSCKSEDTVLYYDRYNIGAGAFDLQCGTLP